MLISRSYLRWKGLFGSNAIPFSVKEVKIPVWVALEAPTSGKSATA